MELERGFRVYAIVATPLLVQLIALFRRDVPVPHKLYLDGTFICWANWPLCLVFPKDRILESVQSGQSALHFFRRSVHLWG